MVFSRDTRDMYMYMSHTHGWRQYNIVRAQLQTYCSLVVNQISNYIFTFDDK